MKKEKCKEEKNRIMFNRTSNNSSNNSTVNFNAPATGIIQKSSEKSFFLRMAQTSELAKSIFEDKGSYLSSETEENYPYHKIRKPIIILQVLLTHNEWFLVEVIYEEDVLDKNDEDKKEKGDNK